MSGSLAPVGRPNAELLSKPTSNISVDQKKIMDKIKVLTDSFCPCPDCLKDLASLIKEIKSTPSLNAAELLPPEFKVALSNLDILANANAKALEAFTGEPITPLNPESSLAPITSNDLHVNQGLVESLLKDPAFLQNTEGTLDPTLFQNLADKQDQLLGPLAKEMRVYTKNEQSALKETLGQLKSLAADQNTSPALKEIVTKLIANMSNAKTTAIARQMLGKSGILNKNFPELKTFFTISRISFSS